MTSIDRAASTSASLEPPASWIAQSLQFDRSGDTFVAPQPEAGPGRLFGGHIAAQALASAAATIEPDKLPQSLHAYFVRGGRPGVDVAYEVERTRDGRSFDTRRVTASQEGDVILEMITSFHVPESGADTHPPGPALSPPDDAASLAVPGELNNRFEIRTPERDGDMFMGPPFWIRSVDVIEDDPVIRACALTYMSDIGLMAAARPPGMVQFGTGVAASLDHSVWFHRPFQPHRWHRYETSALNNNDARGLALGAFYDESGSLIATMTQEALWRV